MQNHAVNFVYAPRSGPRWLDGAGPRDYISTPVVLWPNYSAHTLGVRVSVDAARPGHHWRGLARDVAAAIARRFGGVAWDDRGTVSVVVPPNVARYAAACLYVADPFATAAPDPAMLAALLGVSPAHGDVVARWRELLNYIPANEWVQMFLHGYDPLAGGPAPRRTYSVRTEENRTIVAIRIAETEYTVTAPAAWGEPLRVYNAEEIPAPAPDLCRDGAVVDCELV